MAGNIINLMYRDFCVYWSVMVLRIMIFGVLFVLSAAPLFRSQNLTIAWAASQAFILINIVTIMVFRLEFFYRTDKFFASLPIRRMDLVLARYAEVFAAAVFLLLLGYLGNSVVAFFDRPDLHVPLVYHGAVSIAILLVASFSLPFYYKIEAMKAYLIPTLPLVIMASYGLMYGLSGNRKASEMLFDSWLKNHFSMGLVIAGFAILLFVTSAKLSITLYSKKDI